MRFGFLIALAPLITGACAHLAVTASVPAAPVADSKASGDLQARILRARVEANPSDTNARMELARYYQRAGFPEIAAEHLRLACEKDPESSAAHIFLAKILRAEKRPAEAASVLRTFSERHQDDGEVWAWLGVLEDEAGNLKAGEAASRRAIALEPNRDDLENNLGYSLLEQGRKSEAADAFRVALGINPKSALARNNLAMALAGGNLALVSQPGGQPAAIAARKPATHHASPFAAVWHWLRPGSTNEKNKEMATTFASQ